MPSEKRVNEYMQRHKIGDIFEVNRIIYKSILLWDQYIFKNEIKHTYYHIKIN